MSKCGAVFVHTIVIRQRRTWRWFRWVIGLFWRGVGVTPRIRCARCLPVIRRCCHVILCISYHVIMCISFCIRVRLMHPSIFPVVRFAIRHSYVIRRSPFVFCCERVLNFLGMARGLPSGLGIAPVDRLSSFVPFGARLILQRLTG